MKIRKSELSLIDFQIFKSELEFVPPKKNGHIDKKKLFSKYEIDVDFSIVDEDDYSNVVLIFTKCNINSNKSLPGYVIHSEGVTVFDISVAKELLSEEDAISLVQISGLSIAINNMRNYIQQLTYFGPLQDLQLPAIDINDLFRQKEEKFNSEEE